ncbi:MAG: hypothetical protein CL758_07945 [Chloroflexi bacterium]|nr:hypothetical protein [Chloroflexota bacterium]
MEQTIDDYSKQKKILTKKIIFADVNSNFQEIKKIINKNKDSKIISFDYKTHKKMNDEKLDHIFSDIFINDTECKELQEYVYKFTYWFHEKEFSELLNYRGINIGKLYQDEILNFFVRFLKKFKEIENIFHQNKEVEFFADNELYKIISFFTRSCINIGNSNEVMHAFTHDEIKIGLKIGKSQKNIFLDEKRYLKLRNFMDRVINNFFTPKISNDKKTNIMFVEYNTDRFKDLFLTSKENNSNIFFYGRKRPPFWNFSTLKTIINSKCRIITENFIYDKMVEEKYLEADRHMKNQISKLWKKQDMFDRFFSFEEKTIFELIKPVLIELIENRLSSTLKEIELAYRMFEKVNIDYSVVINEVGFYEQIISSLSKEFNIKCVHMQEGYHWDSKEVNQNLTSQGVFLHNAEKLLVWGNVDKKLAIENASILPEKIEIIGAPRYDSFFGSKPKRGEYILLASSADPQPEEIEGLRIHKIENYLSDILKICKVVSKLDERLVVKLHPSPTQLTNLEQLTRKINSEIKVLASGDITELLPNAKILICIGISSAMIEALILNKPVIFIPGIDYNWKNPSLLNMNGCLSSNIKNIRNDLLRILNDDYNSSEMKKASEEYLSKLINYQGYSSKKFYELMNQ